MKRERRLEKVEIGFVPWTRLAWEEHVDALLSPLPAVLGEIQEEQSHERSSDGESGDGRGTAGTV